MKIEIAKALSQPGDVSCFASYQALQFLDYFRRLPLSITLPVAFQEWSTSKDLDHTIEEAILAQVLDLLDSALDGPFDPKVSLALDAVIREEDG